MAVIEDLQHIREMQINDLRKADDASANFLVCVGCFNATEILGGIENERLGSRQHVTERLKSGIALLGYQHREQDLIALRNSMTHAYLGQIADRDVRIANKNSISPLFDLGRGIQIVNGMFIVNVSRWIEELEKVWSKVLAGLDADPEKADRIAAILTKLPILR